MIVINKKLKKFFFFFFWEEDASSKCFRLLEYPKDIKKQRLRGHIQRGK
jgi:hypothetical protein